MKHLFTLIMGIALVVGAGSFCSCSFRASVGAGSLKGKESGKTATINGIWSNEEVINSEVDLEMEIEQVGKSFEGVLDLQQYKHLSRTQKELIYSSGITSITNGMMTGNTGEFLLVSPRGAEMGSGRLSALGATMNVILNIKGQEQITVELWK